MSKHTPGPWRMSYDRGYFVEPVARDTIGRICEVHNTGLSDKIAIANTRLIAAAPDLLETLREIAADPIGSNGAIARAAIAKIEGHDE